MNQETARTILLEHSRSPKNGSFPVEVTFTSKLTNPLCGDFVELRIFSDEEKILDVGFKAVACAICSASSSLLCQELKGMTLTESLELFNSFESILLAPSSRAWPKNLENFLCFEHLRINPARKACALLPWVALKSALKPNRELH